MVQVDQSRLAELLRSFDVARLRVFGSSARGEERPDSDVDLIVDFSSPKGFFAIIRLEAALEELLGRPVDLVTEDGLSPYFRDEVVASASTLFDDAA